MNNKNKEISTKIEPTLYTCHPLVSIYDLMFHSFFQNNCPNKSIILRVYIYHGKKQYITPHMCCSYSSFFNSIRLFVALPLSADVIISRNAATMASVSKGVPISSLMEYRNVPFGSNSSIPPCTIPSPL